MPPPWIRRPLTVAIWLIVSTVFLLLAPLVLVVTAATSALTGRSQPLIAARLAVAYFVRELAGLIACGALWCASGAGLRLHAPRFQEMHWRLLRWYAHGIAERAISLLDIKLVRDEAPEATRALDGVEPLLLFSRHAGPGDSILLIDQLVTQFHRRPSVVLKQAVALDPCVDLLAHRLPHAVLDPADSDESQSQIEQTAADLGTRGLLLLFPEGANFSPQRRRSAIARLRRKGKNRAAAQAERMRHVLPPRPAGALAALRGNPGADVIFAAHTGLGLAAHPREIWRDMPVGRTLRQRMWLVSATQRPSDPEQQLGWLSDMWKLIDRWVDTHRDPDTRSGLRDLPVGRTGTPNAGETRHVCGSR